MITRNWERVYRILGDAVFSHIYKDYIIFLKTRDDSLVQISGTNIFVYLNDKLGRLQQAFYEGERRQKGKEETKDGEEGEDAQMKQVVRKHVPSHKYNLKNEKDDYTNNAGKSTWDDIVNRNRLFFCSHMNRKNAFFQKHILNSKIPSEALVAKISKDILGFTRVRKSVRDKLDQMLRQVVKNQKSFDYNYYLCKNCPMPQDWKEKKPQLIEDAKRGGQDRARVYKFLNDESTSDCRNVANFLTEWVA